MRALRAAILLLVLGGCVGGVGKMSEDADATIMEPGPSTGEDGATPRPRADGGSQEAGTRADAGRQDPARDARVDAPPEAGAPDTGAPGTDASMAMEQDAGGTPQPSGRPTFVAVGYRGARLVSRDLGLTWEQSAELVGGGDDQNLLRGVAFAKGRFVAVGWKLWSTTDGTSWTQHDNPSGQWMGGVKFGNDVFAAVGGVGLSVYSRDGVSWSRGMPRSNGRHARAVAFGEGQFMASDDENTWWLSTDGNSWARQAGGRSSNLILWCKDRFAVPADCREPSARSNGRTAYGMGVWIAASGGKIERSTDGTSWSTVKDVNTTPVEDVAFGYLP